MQLAGVQQNSLMGCGLCITISHAAAVGPCLLRISTVSFGHNHIGYLVTFSANVHNLADAVGGVAHCTTLDIDCTSARAAGGNWAEVIVTLTDLVALQAHVEHHK
eukprot:TRINITY_DN63501_c1_g1_i2.p1 TRINITY_DN63501_c1_g1~~TRINITY_DN63501_c1_g1_i2.p1  ORF type:complete len:105 (+),score=3.43 TRINITY_DN63501_c1_g1_i2:470-784(+)